MYETLISVDQLQELQQGDAPIAIVDCRFSLANAEWGRKEFLNGHIPGAVYANLNTDLSAPVIVGKTGRHPLPAAEDFIEWVRNAGITNAMQVIAYDQGNGGYASRLWWLMRWIGHPAVAVLDGGWISWQQANGACEGSENTPLRSDFVPSMHDDLTVEAGELLTWCNDQRFRIIDSRESRRYDGIEEPIDPVAGHIPGAINRPYAENMRADGHWRSPEELRQRFVEFRNERDCNAIAFYCGSGVTACHNVLAFKHAGLGDAKLYPGSWSEWITDVSRGVEM